MSGGLCIENAAERVNSKETVLPELAKCYSRLMSAGEPQGDRITGLLPIVAGNDGEIAVSMVERGQTGSERFAVFIYEVLNQGKRDIASFERQLIDGRTVKLCLKDLKFDDRCDFGMLHELCTVIESAMDDYYADDLFCDR